MICSFFMSEKKYVNQFYQVIIFTQMHMKKTRDSARVFLHCVEKHIPTNESLFINLENAVSLELVIDSIIIIIEYPPHTIVNSDRSSTRNST